MNGREFHSRATDDQIREHLIGTHRRDPLRVCGPVTRGGLPYTPTRVDLVEMHGRAHASAAISTPAIQAAAQHDH